MNFLKLTNDHIGIIVVLNIHISLLEHKFLEYQCTYKASGQDVFYGTSKVAH